MNVFNIGTGMKYLILRKWLNRSDCDYLHDGLFSVASSKEIGPCKNMKLCLCSEG